MTAEAMTGVVQQEFRRRVLEEYLPRIRSCVEKLDQSALWYRPGPHNNSVGNLLRHLAGNTRQWILSGIGGEPDARDRAGEFAPDDPRVTGEELMEKLEETVRAAVEVVDAMTPGQMVEVRRFQSLWDETGLAAVLHVMEHFSGHAGQIYAFTKQTLGIDLRFYDL